MQYAELSSDEETETKIEKLEKLLDSQESFRKDEGRGVTDKMLFKIKFPTASYESLKYIVTTRGSGDVYEDTTTGTRYIQGGRPCKPWEKL